MYIEIYNPKVNSVKAGNIHIWAQKNNLDAVVEIHRNAFSKPSAKGCETLVDYRQNSPMMTNLHRELAKLDWSDRGLKPANGNGGRSLQNPRLMWQAKIPYALLELGFITNAQDNLVFDKNISNIAKIIIDIAKQSGIERLGIVYGHGQGDPGACSGKRQEAADVRKIEFISPKEEETELKKEEVEAIIDEKLKRFKDSLSTSEEGKDHWVDRDFEELNAFLEENGIDKITSKQHNAFATRAIMIRIANLIVKALKKERR